MDFIQLSGITKKFESGGEVLTILDNLDLNVPEGSITVFTGESGSGKSTLLNIIGSLDSPDAGQVMVDRRRVDTMNEAAVNRYRAESVGFVFQFHYLLDGFTALENVMLPAYMTGVPRRTAVEKARDLLARVGMEHRLDHTPAQLSGGERQRAALARSMVNNPGLLLADEPTGNLDEGNTAKVKELLFSLVRDLGKTLLLVTHDPQLIPEGDYAYRLHAGKLELL